MSAIINGLLAYMARTSNDQFEKDIAALEEYNSIGPDVSSFLEQLYATNNGLSEITLKNTEKNSGFNLDSFFLSIFEPLYFL